MASFYVYYLYNINMHSLFLCLLLIQYTYVMHYACFQITSLSNTFRNFIRPFGFYVNNRILADLVFKGIDLISRYSSLTLIDYVFCPRACRGFFFGGGQKEGRSPLGLELRPVGDPSQDHRDGVQGKGCALPLAWLSLFEF